LDDRHAGAGLMRLAWPTLALMLVLLGLQLVVFRQLAGIDRTFDRIEGHLGSIDATPDRIETRFDRIEARLGRIEALMAEILQRMQRLEQRGAPP
jgi:hypothetical protein